MRPVWVAHNAGLCTVDLFTTHPSPVLRYYAMRNQRAGLTACVGPEGDRTAVPGDATPQAALVAVTSILAVRDLGT